MLLNMAIGSTMKMMVHLKDKVYYRNGQVIKDDVLERHLDRLKKAKTEQKTKL